MPAASRAPRSRTAARARGTHPGYELLAHDRRLGKRFVAGADEAGRGAHAGPLVCAAVVLDIEALQGARACPLAELDDSKQLAPELRERLYGAVLVAATRIAVRVVPAAEVDRAGLGRANADGLRGCLTAVAAQAQVFLVDYFRLGEGAPPHTSIVRGDGTSAAIAAASVVAKVTRDRLMQRLDELHPEYGFRSHVGYITRAHEAAVREHGLCAQHRRSFAVKSLRGG